MLPAKRKILFKGRAKKLRWGVAGCGKFTENAVLPLLNQLTKSRVVSIYSSSDSRAKELANKFSVDNHFDNYSEFLNSEFDVLYVGSANQDHAWQVIEAAKAGKHILCEKPLALNSEEAAQMVEACDNNHVHLSLDYVHRFHPLVRKAKELIKNGIIGRVISVEASFNFDFPPDGNYRFNPDFGGGPLMDVGTHMIDLLRYLNGEIDAAKGYMDNIIYKSKVEDFSAALLKFNNGGYGIINVSFNAKKAPNQIFILGHEGYLTIDNIIASRNIPAKLTIDLYNEARKTFRKRANLLLIRLREFQKAMLNGETPEINGYDGLKNIQIMEMIREDATGK